MLQPISLFLTVLACSSITSAASITFPGGSLTVPSLTSAGASFVYGGTLTQNDTLRFTAAGDPCLQAGAVYCTNAAGIVVVAGTSGVGQTSTFTGTFGGTTGIFNFGAVLLSISGVGTVQIFPANAADGLGSVTPPTNLALPNTSLSALGFGSFGQANPTVTFLLADTLYTDNSGSFSLSQVPEPGVCGLAALGMAAITVLTSKRRRRAGAQSRS